MEKKTTIFKTAAVLTVALAVFLASCMNPATPPPSNPPAEQQKSGVKIDLGLPTEQTRTIMPETGIEVFEQFRLVFTSTDPDPIVLTIEDTWLKNQLTGTIDLEVGNWDLVVTAFLDPNDDVTDLDLIAAKSGVIKVVVTAGAITPVNVHLQYVQTVTRTGTFEYDISYDVPGDYVSSVMDITPINGTSGTPQTGIDVLANGTGNKTLTSGYYEVTVITTNKDGETVRVVDDVLHVYDNMTSTFTREIETLDFPVTLLKYILQSWNTATNKWDFGIRQIDARHFTKVRVAGVDAVDFDEFTKLLDPITAVGGVPNPATSSNKGLDQLQDLVDVALVKYAIEIDGLSGDISEFETLADVETELETFPQNHPGTLTVKVTDDPAIPGEEITVDFSMGNYTDTWKFYELDGVVSITGLPIAPEKYSRVGDVLTADPTGLTTGSGSFEFAWSLYVRASTSETEPDPEDIVGKGTEISTRDADPKYTIAPTDVKGHITAQVWRIGCFGFVIAQDRAGPILEQPGQGDITIVLDPIEGFDHVANMDINTTIDESKIITVAPVTGATMGTVEWSIDDGNGGSKPIGNNTATLTVDSNIYGDKVSGRLNIFAKADINGLPHSVTIQVNLHL